MSTEQEIQHICRRSEISSPIYGEENSYPRLKRYISRAADAQGDGHPLMYRWGKADFDPVDPEQFLFGSCSRCGFTGALDAADYRQAAKDPDRYKSHLATQF